MESDCKCVESNNAIQHINRVVSSISTETYTDDVVSSAVIYVKNFSNTTLKQVQTNYSKVQQPEAKLEIRAQLLMAIRILVQGILSCSIKRTHKFHFDVVVKRMILEFLRSDSSNQQQESFQLLNEILT